MDTKQYPELLEALYRLQVEHGLHVPVSIWGPAGIGKTAIPHQFARDYALRLGQEFRCVVIKPGQADSAGDLVGMPQEVTYQPCPACRNGMGARMWSRDELARHVHEEHGITGVTFESCLQETAHLAQRRQRFSITDIWPTTGRGILVIDELNRAPQDLQNSLLGLVQERRMELTGYEVPPGFIVIATSNPPSDDYTGTQELDLAMATRFVHFDLEPRVRDWLSYMQGQEYASKPAARRIRDFFAAHQDWIGCKAEENPVIVEQLKPCPRQAENLVRLGLVLDGQLLFEAARGVAGPAMAPVLMEYLRSHEASVQGRDILQDYAAVRSRVQACFADRDNVRIDAANAAVEDLLAVLDGREEMLTSKEADHVTTFLSDLTGELVMKFGRAMFDARDRGGHLARHLTHLQSTHPGFEDVILHVHRLAAGRRDAP